jgi:hypothetical protein
MWLDVSAFTSKPTFLLAFNRDSVFFIIITFLPINNTSINQNLVYNSSPKTYFFFEYLIYYLFICGLFNKAPKKSDYRPIKSSYTFLMTESKMDEIYVVI